MIEKAVASRLVWAGVIALAVTAGIRVAMVDTEKPPRTIESTLKRMI